MRLTDDQIKMARITYTKVVQDDFILDLIDTIEALQQENEQLRAKLEDWKHEVQCHMDEVIAREKQIEQLRAQVARMRELLTKAYDEIEKYKCLWKGSKPADAIAQNLQHYRMKLNKLLQK